jgi:hypothetical protein
MQPCALTRHVRPCHALLLLRIAFSLRSRKQNTPLARTNQCFRATSGQLTSNSVSSRPYGVSGRNRGTQRKSSHFAAPCPALAHAVAGARHGHSRARRSLSLVSFVSRALLRRPLLHSRSCSQVRKLFRGPTVPRPPSEFRLHGCSGHVTFAYTLQRPPLFPFCSVKTCSCSRKRAATR